MGKSRRRAHHLTTEALLNRRSRTRSRRTNLARMQANSFAYPRRSGRRALVRYRRGMECRKRPLPHYAEAFDTDPGGCFRFVSSAVAGAQGAPHDCPCPSPSERRSSTAGGSAAGYPRAWSMAKRSRTTGSGSSEWAESRERGGISSGRRCSLARSKILWGAEVRGWRCGSFPLRTD